MAQTSGTYSTYDQQGIREDLHDVITNIAPTATPFMNNIGSSTAENTYWEWQEDTLDTAVATNAHIEGDNESYTAPTATVKLGNRTQISKKSVIVTGTARSVNTAGRADELAYQVALKGKALKRDMESSAFANNAVVTGDDSTARETGGLVAWIKTNESKASDGLAPDYTTSPTDTRSDGTQAAFTEAMLKTVMASCFDNGGEPTMLFVGSANKQTVSGFAGIAALRKQVDGMRGTIVGAADVYGSDFGDLAVIPSRFQRARDALFIDPEHVSIAYLRNIQLEDRAKTGDADRKVILAEWGLKVHSEKAHGIAADLTT